MSVEEYLARANVHLKLARNATDPRRKAMHLEFAQRYQRLAGLARKNAANDRVDETPSASEPPRRGERQRIQPEHDDKGANRAKGEEQ